MSDGAQDLSAPGFSSQGPATQRLDVQGSAGTPSSTEGSDGNGQPQNPVEGPKLDLKSDLARALVRLASEVLVPLVESDGGELYLVTLTSQEIGFHLAGRFAGCPGNDLTTRRVLSPVIAAIAPELKTTVTWGGLIPLGALRLPLSPAAAQ